MEILEQCLLRTVDYEKMYRLITVQEIEQLKKHMNISKILLGPDEWNWFDCERKIQQIRSNSSEDEEEIIPPEEEIIPAWIFSL